MRRAVVAAIIAALWSVPASAAVTVTERASSFSDTDGTSFATASVTGTSGSCFYLLFGNSKGTTPDAITGITGWGSWTQVATQIDGNGTPSRRGSIWRSAGDGSSGALTVSFGANTQTAGTWKVIEVTGMTADCGTAVVQ